jgi:hypothetical protein
MPPPDKTARGWLARLGRALNPESGKGLERLHEVQASLEEWHRARAAEADEQGRRMRALESGVASLMGDTARVQRDLVRDVGKLRRLAARHREDLVRVSRLAAVDRRGLDVERCTVDRLARLGRTRLPILVGPWTGEVGFELLYWIPFLRWVRETFPIDPDRLVVLSRGGVRAWYEDISRHYEDIFEFASPDEFRRATEQRRKQQRIGAFDRGLLKAVARRRGFPRVHLLHPGLMYALFKPFWRYDATIKRLDEFARFRSLAAGRSSHVAVDALPPEYVAVRFYFSDCFPDTPENRQFAARLIAGLSARTHVVLLNNDILVDDHRDFSPGPNTRIHVASAPMQPATNLAVQTDVIRRARAFVGTYGGYSYLAPLCGVNAVAFHSRQSFKQHHLEVAQRMLRRIGGAGLVVVDTARGDALGDALGGLVSAAVNSTVE